MNIKSNRFSNRKLSKRRFFHVFLKKEAGFLLFEVIIGLALFAFFATSMLTLHQTTAKLTQYIALNSKVLGDACNLIEGHLPTKNSPDKFITTQEKKSLFTKFSCSNKKNILKYKNDQKTKQYQQISVTCKKSNHTICLVSCG